MWLVSFLFFDVVAFGLFGPFSQLFVLRVHGVIIGSETREQKS